MADILAQLTEGSQKLVADFGLDNPRPCMPWIILIIAIGLGIYWILLRE